MHPVYRKLGLLPLLPLLALAGCRSPETQMMSQDTTSPATDSAVEQIEAKFKQNSSPKQAYRVTLSIADAPGPFAVIEGFAQYVALDCTYTINELEGATAHPEKRIPVTYTKVDERTYTGVVHIDAMQDEDYFGKGVCHWNLVVVSAQLRATGAQGETRFFAALQRDALLAHQPQTSLHKKQRYPRDPAISDVNSLGLDPPTDDMFPLTFTSEAVTP